MSNNTNDLHLEDVLLDKRDRSSGDIYNILYPLHGQMLLCFKLLKLLASPTQLKTLNPNNMNHITLANNISTLALLIGLILRFTTRFYFPTNGIKAQG